MKLRRRILLPLFIAFSLFLLIFVFTLKSYHLSGISKSTKANNEIVFNTFHELLEDRAEFMLEVIEMLEDDHDLKHHLDRRNREAILKTQLPLFERLRKDHGITHFYFTGPDRVNLLRLHQPDRYGDEINRYTTINAGETGLLQYGIELGPMGTFTLRSVIPWYIDNRLIGFVELGQEIEHIIDSIRGITKTELYIIINKKFVSKAGWQSGMNMLDRRSTWELMSSYVLTYQPKGVQWDEVGATVERLKSLPSGQLIDVELNDSDYLATLAPLLDAQGKGVGHMLILNDVTDANYRAMHATKINGLVGITLVSFLVFLFYLLAGKAEERLEISRNALVAEMDKRVAIQQDHAGEMQHLALHDPLTGLPNQNYFHLEVGTIIELSKKKKQSFAVLVVSISRYREIIDTLGHKAGDKLLTELHGRIMNELNAASNIARITSNLLGMIISPIEREKITKVVSQVSKCVALPFLMEDFDLHIEGNIGISFYPDHGEDAGLLIQRANVANYLSKDSHTSFAIYDEESDPYSKERLAVMAELRHSIDAGDLRLHYQPKVDLKTGKVNDVEALVRWEHPEKGFIPPDDFIPMAERTGLIHPLTAWVFNEAISQQKRWHDAGLDLRIAVNVSANILRNPRFPQRVRELLHANEVDPSKLVVEITESAIMADPEDAAEMLSILDGMGIAISIDDFGTGYSSLAYLSRLPVSELKIDRSFVIGMANNDNDVIIIRSTVDLGRNLGLKVVAEGVESQYEWDQLATLGCDMIQGYHISKPRPGDDFEQWLKVSSFSDMGKLASK